MKATYLDYNATAPVRPEVMARMQEILAVPSNPSSAHRFGREAKKHLEDARKTIADSISAWTNEIIFTASATEANTTALRGISGRRLLVSVIEHSSVLKVRNDEELIPVDGNGVVKLDALDELCSRGPAIVSVMLANNETGVIQPISDIAAICKKHGALLHCDAVQGPGKLRLDFGALGVDMMTIAAHKCGGPVGAAALVVRRDLAVTPLLVGGGQELSRRAGTENVAAIAGFALAIEKAADLTHMKNVRQWLDAMEAQMVKNRGVMIMSKAVPRLPNTTCVAMPEVGNEVQLMDFDLQGFAVSAGSACSSGRIEVSHVLLAMGVPKAQAGSAIRVSAGWGTTEAEIGAFTEAWRRTCERLATSRKSA